MQETKALCEGARQMSLDMSESVAEGEREGSVETLPAEEDTEGNEG